MLGQSLYSESCVDWMLQCYGRVCTASRTWTGCCNARAESVQRVVRGLDAAMLGQSAQ